MYHITEAEFAPVFLFCMSSRYFLALQCHFLVSIVVIAMENASGNVKVLKVHRRASRAILYGSSCVVIWYIVSFGQKYTDRPLRVDEDPGDLGTSLAPLAYASFFIYTRRKSK
jgi:hypothetical protein